MDVELMSIYIVMGFRLNMKLRIIMDSLFVIYVKIQ